MNKIACSYINDNYPGLYKEAGFWGDVAAGAAAVPAGISVGALNFLKDTASGLTSGFGFFDNRLSRWIDSKDARNLPGIKALANHDNKFVRGIFDTTRYAGYGAAAAGSRLIPGGALGVLRNGVQAARGVTAARAANAASKAAKTGKALAKTTNRLTKAKAAVARNGNDIARRSKILSNAQANLSKVQNTVGAAADDVINAQQRVSNAQTGLGLAKGRTIERRGALKSAKTSYRGARNAHMKADIGKRAWEGVDNGLKGADTALKWGSKISGGRYGQLISTGFVANQAANQRNAQINQNILKTFSQNAAKNGNLHYNNDFFTNPKYQTYYNTSLNYDPYAAYRMG